MFDELGGVTSQLVNLALDGLMKRHDAIAHNIANVETPNYVPKNVDFEPVLSQYLSATGQLDVERLRAEYTDLQETIASDELLVSSGDAEVKLDREVVKLTENVIQYRALLEAKSQLSSLLKTAISEGK